MKRSLIRTSRSPHQLRQPRARIYDCLFPALFSSPPTSEAISRDRCHQTFGKFAPPSRRVAIEAFDLFLRVFQHFLLDGAKKPWRLQNPADGAGFETGTSVLWVKDAPSRTPRQSERRSLLAQCHKSCVSKSSPDFFNLGALSHFQFGPSLRRKRKAQAPH